MTATQLGLALTGSTEPVDAPRGRQHIAVLVALYREGERGLNGEEAAERCRFDDAHIATSRMGEMAEGKSWDSEKFPVPLTWRSAERERPYARSRVNAFVFRLTDAGLVVAHDLATNGDGA